MNATVLLCCAVALALALSAQSQTFVTLPPPFASFAIVSQRSVDNYYESDFLVGFDVTELTSNTTGGVSADWYRDCLLSPYPAPTALEPNAYNQLPLSAPTKGRWMVIAEDMVDGVYEDAVTTWTRGRTIEIFQGNYYEIRFPEVVRQGGMNPVTEINYAFIEGWSNVTVEVPFEAWFLGSDPSNSSTATRIVVGFKDVHHNGVFDFWMEKTGEGAVSDYMNFYVPLNPVPGNDQYHAWRDDPNHDLTNFTEHVASVSLFNWHLYEGGDGHAFSGTADAMPTKGTIFRIAGGYYPPRCLFVSANSLPQPRSSVRLTSSAGIFSVTVVEESVIVPEIIASDGFGVGDTEGYLYSRFPRILEEEPTEQLYDTTISIVAGDGALECDIGDKLTNHGYHYVGNVAFATNNVGEIHDSFFADEGFVYPYKGVNPFYSVFGGGLWVSTNHKAVYTYFPTDDPSYPHWNPVSNMNTQINFADQDTYATFDDALEGPGSRVYGLSVDARHLTWADAGNNNYGIFWYRLHNTVSTALLGLQVGLLVDGDTGEAYATDSVAYDEDLFLLYSYSAVNTGNDQRYVGVHILNYEPTSASAFDKRNIKRQDVSRLMQNPVFTQESANISDQQMVLSTTVDVRLRAPTDVVFGVVVSKTLEDLRTSLVNMVQRYQTIVDSEQCFEDLSICNKTDIPCRCIEQHMECTENAGRACPRAEYRDQLAQICAQSSCNTGCCANLFNECQGQERDVCYDVTIVPSPTPTPVNSTSPASALVSSLVLLAISAICALMM